MTVSDTPASQASNEKHLLFNNLSLIPQLLSNLESLGFEAMTPIQAQSLPSILAGHDVIGQACTGSGKTAAFGLGLLNRLDITRFAVQALVLCPTRELADQVARAIRDLARMIPNVKVLALCGGSPFALQAASLEGGVHIVVGTPGRVEDHLRKGTLELGGLKVLVLDEADRMLDMGFQESVDNIVAQTPQQRQSLLFSATYPEEIKAIAQRVLTAPVMAAVEATHDNATIEQHFYRVEDDEQRLTALKLLLLKFRPETALVFCTTREETRDVTEALRSERFSALALHGDLEQRERDRTLLRFANKSVSVLVATDVAARGLDIEALDAVINYRLARDPETHLHRIGRTGRAGSRGQAFTLYRDKENHRIAALAVALERVISSETLPPMHLLEKVPPKPPMVTLQVDGGKKQKLRPGDILGALTGEEGIPAAQVGKISLYDNVAFVAIRRDAAKAALQKMEAGTLKGRRFRVKRL